MENEIEEYKYICEPCRFKCNSEQRWQKHIATELHKTGKRKVRCDYGGPYKCDECNYKTLNAAYFKQHKLNDHSSKETREKEFKFYCKLCDFGTFYSKFMDKHKDTDKHKTHEKYYK